MVEALWGVEFVSNNDDGGYSVAVFETGRVLGGDSSFVWVGSYHVEGGLLRVEIKCTNDRKIIESVFGDVDEFNLNLEGKPARHEFVLEGYALEYPSKRIAVRFTRRAELP